MSSTNGAGAALTVNVNIGNTPANPPTVNTVNNSDYVDLRHVDAAPPKKQAVLRDNTKSFDVLLKEYKAWKPQEDGWVEVDASEATTRTHVLLHGSVRTWRRRDTEDKSMLYKCLCCGKELRQSSIVRALSHVLGVVAHTKLADCEKELTKLIDGKYHGILKHGERHLGREAREYLKQSLRSAAMLAEEKKLYAATDQSNLSEDKSDAKETVMLFSSKRSKQDLDAAIIRFLALHDLPPNIAHGKGWGSLADICAEARMYAEPVRSLSRKDYGKRDGELSKCMRAQVTRANDAFAAALENVTLGGTFGSLCIDAMTKHGRATNNAVLCTARGEMFLRSEEVECAKNEAFHIEYIKNALREIGVDNVSLIVVDGEKAARLATATVCDEKLADGTYKHPMLWHQRCTTHAYSLLIGDILGCYDEHGDERHCIWMHRASACAGEVITFFRSHGFAERARKARNVDEKGEKVARQLKKYVETRFASVFYVLERFVENWRVLLQALSDITCGANGRYEKQEYRQTARTLTQWMSTDSFQFACELTRDILEPIVIALRRTDTKTPNLYRVVGDFYKARADCETVIAQAYAKLSGDASNKVSNDAGDALFRVYANEIRQCFDKRERDILTNNAWGAHALFAPRNFLEPDKDVERMQCAERRVCDFIERVYDPVIFADEFKAAMREWEDYSLRSEARMGRGFFKFADAKERFESRKDGESSADFAARQLEENFHFWDYKLQKENSKLAPIALRLTCGFAGQGSAERANKAVARVYTKTRNRQTAEVTDAFLRIRSHVHQHNARAKTRVSKNQLGEVIRARGDDDGAHAGDTSADESSDDDEPEARSDLLRPSTMRAFDKFDKSGTIYAPVHGNAAFGPLFGMRPTIYESAGERAPPPVTTQAVEQHQQPCDDAAAVVDASSDDTISTPHADERVQEARAQEAPSSPCIGGGDGAQVHAAVNAAIDAPTRQPAPSSPKKRQQEAIDDTIRVDDERCYKCKNSNARVCRCPPAVHAPSKRPRRAARA